MGEFRWNQGPGDPALFDPAVERVVGRGEYRGLEFLQVQAKRIINEVAASSRMPFRWTINAYRGCSHACRYCFARPTHEYLNLDAGRDFETKIVVKVNAVELARAETAPHRWPGDSIAMGTNTDPYQPAEGKYKLTRGIIEVLAARANPFSILTKSSLVLRDLDLLLDAVRDAAIRVDFSVGTLDEEVWKATEPGTPHPRRRVEAMARLNAAGIPSGALIAPVLPGLSDRPEQLAEVVQACLDAGATFVAPILLHLRPGVRQQYLGWLERARPDLLEMHLGMYRGSYPPRSDQDRLAATVRRLVGDGGGITERHHQQPEPRRRCPEQLRLV